MKFKNIKLKYRVSAGVGIPLILLVALATISIMSIRSIQSTGERVDHTHNVIGEANQILASAVDMETGMRGFLLAGKEGFLSPYTEGGAQFDEGVASLQGTVSDNPAQVALLADLQATIGEWKSKVTEPTIALRRQIGDAKTMNDMAALVGEAKGKVYFDKFRQQITTFAGREEALMQERKQTAIESTAAAKSALATVGETTGWVVHTYEVVAQANRIIAAAVDMETGMRGYLLAGEEGFLAPYHSGKKVFVEELTALTKAVSDNPAQVELLGQVRQTIDNWLSKWTEPAIAMRGDVGNGKTLADIAELIASAGGKTYFDSFRGQIATFVERESSLLKSRREQGQVASADVASSIATIAETTQWVDHTHEVIAAAHSVLASGVDMETGMRGFLLAGKDSFLVPYTGGKAAFTEKISALQKTVSDNPAQVELLGKAQSTIWNWLNRVADPTIQLRRIIGNSETMDDMADLVSEARGKVYFDKFREQIGSFVAKEAELMDQRKLAAESTASNAVSMTFLGAIFALVLGIVISFFVISSIVGPVGKVAASLDRLADGDLTATVDVDSGDEIGLMAKSLNQALSRTEEAMQVIGSSAVQLQGNAVQLNESSQSLANDTAQQAASLEEVSASLEEVSSGSVQNDENAQRASVISDQSNTTASNGLNEMESMTTAMSEIKQSSSEISSIIKVIDDIAFQTNLLALNAAVEAARAGDAGKGFAVVAEEVRNLAQRSAEAAKSTSEMIVIAAQRADNGVAIAGRVGDALQEIASSTTEVSGLLVQIATISQQQSTGVGEVTVATRGLDQITQNSAGSSEELAAAAKETSAQVDTMQGLVGRFVIGNS